MDADREAVGEELLRRDDVDILDGCGTRRVEVRVVAGEFSAVPCLVHQLSKRGREKAGRRTVHPSSDLASPLVRPTNGSKVGLVVHEPAVKVRLGVRVCSEDWMSNLFVVSELEREAHSCW